MNDEKTAFSFRLNAVLDWRGFARKNYGRQTKLAARFNIGQKGARKWLEGEAIPRLDTIRAIAEEFDINMEWLHYGHGPVSDYQDVVGQGIYQARCAKGWSEANLACHLINHLSGPYIVDVVDIQAIESGTCVIISPPLDVYADALDVSESWLMSRQHDNPQASSTMVITRDNDDYVTVPQFSAIGSMGKGIPIDLDHDEVVSLLSVSRSWLQENLSSISSLNNLAMITGYGDSMESTFSHGDLLFVDTAVRCVNIDAVYVLNFNDELYIKRLQRRPDGSILMISDNVKYQPYIIENVEKNSLQVLGRIIGLWNLKRI